MASLSEQVSTSSLAIDNAKLLTVLINKIIALHPIVKCTLSHIILVYQRGTSNSLFLTCKMLIQAGISNLCAGVQPSV